MLTKEPTDVFCCQSVHTGSECGVKVDKIEQRVGAETRKLLFRSVSKSRGSCPTWQYSVLAQRNSVPRASRLFPSSNLETLQHLVLLHTIWPLCHCF